MHHRDRHWLSNFAKFATGDRSSCNNYRSRDVRRSEGLTPVQPGIASQGTEAPGTLFLGPLSLFGVVCSG